MEPRSSPRRRGPPRRGRLVLCAWGFASVLGLAPAVWAETRHGERASAADHRAPAEARTRGPVATLHARLRPSARARDRAARRTLRAFRHTVIDVSRDRGGNGDVAAGYLTALDLRARIGHRGAITLLTHDKGLRVLSRMAGKSLAAGDVIDHPNGPIQLHTRGSYPATAAPADLLLAMATQRGRAESLLDVAGPAQDDADDPTKRPVALAKSAVVVAQTVYGNEDSDVPWMTPHATMRSGGESFEVRRAGVGVNEAGVYGDPVAAGLRHASPAERERFVRRAIRRMPRGASRTALAALEEGRLLAGSEAGLVYGISGWTQARGVVWTHQLHKQFASYLDGLHAAALAEGRSFTLVTPSRYGAELIPDHLREHVRYVHAEQAASLPARAEPGTIYIVETETLPHEVFVGLMARSRVPPIVSGDGALAAAVALGRPFVLTATPINKSIVETVGRRLVEHLGTAQAAGIKSMFRPRKNAWPLLSYDETQDAERRAWRLAATRAPLDLSQALQLDQPEYRAAFARLADDVGNLTDHVLENVRDVRHAQGAPAGTLAPTRDPVLQLSLSVRAAAAGSVVARRRVVAAFARMTEERLQGLMLDGVLTPEAARLPAIRRVLERRALSVLRYFQVR